MSSSVSSTSVSSPSLKAFKALTSVAALLSMTMSTAGCTDEDVATIGGTIAIVAGVVAIGAATDSRDHGRDHGGWRDDRGRDSGRDHGGWREDRGRGRGGGRGHGGGRFSKMGFELSEESPLAKNKTLTLSLNATNHIAMKYHLPLESAERFTKVLQKSAAGDAKAFAAMGLADQEMKRLARLKMPSDTALSQIGVSLAMSRDMARGLIQQLMDETRGQMADVTSPLWTACQTTGKWKTDANVGTCTATGGLGCSPETGASMCAAL